MTGILGKKIGMTQIYSEEGKRLNVTVIEAGPCPVLAIRQNKVQLGFIAAPEKKLKKPELGYFKKLNIKLTKGKIYMDNIFLLHANICKTLANPRRLEIIAALQDEEFTATQLTQKIKISKANLSQHMSILIEKGVVLSRREGINVFYKLSDERITKACDLMREVLIKNLEKNNYLLKDIQNLKENKI